MNKQEIISNLLERHILITPDLLAHLPEDIDSQYLLELATKHLTQPHLVLNKEIYSTYTENTVLLQEPPAQLHPPQRPLPTTETQPFPNEARVTILKSYTKEPTTPSVQDFVNYFKSRYEALKKILLGRPELQNSISISRASKKPEREHVSIIGMITEKNTTKNGNIMLTVEDPTGTIKVLITKTKQDLIEQAQDLVLDEVIGIVGTTGNAILFCNTFLYPDVPLTHELKKSPDEVYAVFVSDIHFGIKSFLEEDFTKFIQWLNGEYGTEQQRDIAKKVRYLFVVGDIVEGVGIYPGQDEDLNLLDIYQQYELATHYFSQIPRHINIIICGGNHDAMRIAEPQPLFDPKISKGFYTLPNMTIVSNPSLVNIHASEYFPGFNVLLYHGFSLTYYADNVPSIRQRGGQDRCDLILKFYLQRRHLAPTHGSTPYFPDSLQDPLVIDTVPDILVTGHIHRIVAGTYRNVTILNSSCWVTQSENQARRGIVPDPAKIPLINLKTREIKIMNFRSDHD
ncbi:MAG TPA: DNA-directed DNA polymerase II small subunit [Candidatus Nanoarchaeia archaeon]|nr:DNA-directed DNA polymerase II small subunit [Candidatus Nanoarchaeia archaeon]